LAITDPEAVRFVNEQVRPLCEEARALMARVGAMTTSWNAGINASFSNNADTLENGREAEGVSRLTALQVSQAVGQLQAVSALNTEIIAKPCVRPLAAS
jgi:hypothetical protein